MDEERIEELEEELESQKSLVDSLKSELREIRRILETHSHDGEDGSVRQDRDIELPNLAGFVSGNSAFVGFAAYDDDVNIVAITTGEQKGSGIVNPFHNSQVEMQHQNSSGLTFYRAIRGPFFTGNDGEVVSGGSSFTQSAFNFTPGELTNAWLLVYENASSFEVYQISGNSAKTITITGGTWSFNKTNAQWFTFIPIYLGSADVPWRRAYVGAGTDGGVRFGYGDTNGGQNSLLYEDGGALKYRKRDGSSTTIVAA